MYETVSFIHSWWAYLVLLVLIIATVNFIIGISSKKEYGATDFRLALFTLIVSHIQLLIGIVLYFLSPYFKAFGQVGMGEVMKDSTLRLYLVEHPLMMIIAVTLITIGYSKHKNKRLSNQKFKTLGIFYGIALVFVLSRIPWSAWF
jgi:heme A synthase